MSVLATMISRNRKLFFRDKGMFFSSMITPVILIVLYVTFLAKVYKDSFSSNLPEMLNVSEKLINGTVAAQLTAALLAVTCVTVTFCVNLTMVQDKALCVRKDFDIAPVSRPRIYLGYFLATVLNSLLINGLALLLCLGYIKMMGWYLTAGDIVLLIADIFILVMFGAVFSSLVCYPLTTQGQLSAVETIISAFYGFVCGAYMPISNFGEGLQRVLSYLPCTYGTAMMKNHMLRGVFESMKAEGLPAEVVATIGDSLDCNPVFRGSVVFPSAMMGIMVISVIVLGVIYLMITMKPEKKMKQ